MKNLWINSLLVAAAGSITYKAVKTVMYYKKQQDLYSVVEEDAKDEK